MGEYSSPLKAGLLGGLLLGQCRNGHSLPQEGDGNGGQDLESERPISCKGHAKTMDEHRGTLGPQEKWPPSR